VLVAILALLGSWLLRRLIAGLAWTRATRLLVALAGVAGLVTWSGFVVGPLVVLGSALAPPWQD
jgi:hypothetical protein